MPKSQPLTVKNTRLTRQISIHQLADLIYTECQKGTVTDEVRESVAKGILPLKELRNQLSWILERSGTGFKLTIEN